MNRVVVDQASLKKTMKQLQEQVLQRVQRAMPAVADKIKDEAVKLAPRKTGDLENSAETAVRISGNSAEAEVSFNTEYAALVHNRMDSLVGPETAAKPATPYGQPGPNYLQNAGQGLGRDGTINRIVIDELKK